MMVLVIILALATGLRAWNLGQLSFWYDEVVTMRLAEAPSPAELVHRLFEIDATRAPLHPLLLQVWVGLFGSSEAAGRAFSVLCGVVTVGLVYWIGRLVFDARAGLWAAYLAALSPPLVYYSREARMYAWLVLLTCVAWGLLFSLSKLTSHFSKARMAAYSLSLAALLYSHPLGLLMAGTLAVGSLGFARQAFGTWRRWLGAHLAALILAAPWLGHYFDHPPEFLSGRLPIRFLIGTPIGFLGGNSLVLVGLLVLIGFGLARRRSDLSLAAWEGAVCLVLWLTVPPTLLYAYSWIGSPVFGPARYTLFVAPAFLILVAQGLAMLPPLPRLALGIALTLLSSASLGPSVYAPDLKADWRALGDEIRKEIQASPGWKLRIIVKSSDPARNVEVETARYYMPEACQVITWDEFRKDWPLCPSEYRTYVAMSIKGDTVPAPPEGSTWEINGRYPGLVVYWVGQPVPAARPAGPEPGAPGG